jgi:DNA-binding helix-hairpin-helix protein with protein kinase domain
LKNPNDRSFTDRQTNSANAKKALLERFKARPGPDDPIMQQRRAERQAVAEARAARDAEKAAARVEAERLAAIERAAQEEAERQAELLREAARKAEQAKRDAERPRKVLLEAVQYAQMRAAGKGRR